MNLIDVIYTDRNFAKKFGMSWDSRTTRFVQRFIIIFQIPLLHLYKKQKNKKLMYEFIHRYHWK